MGHLLDDILTHKASERDEAYTTKLIYKVSIFS